MPALAGRRSRVVGLLLVACLAMSMAASQWQASTSGIGWAVLDLVIHASLAGVVTAVLFVRWGPAPLLASAAAAILIDLDHLVAARSFDLGRIMTLDVRPASHSLAGVLMVVLATQLVAGPRYAYGVAVGLLMHLVRDAGEWPGVPAFVPILADRHVLVPLWMLPVTTVALTALSGACSLVASVGSGWPRAGTARDCAGPPQ